MNNSGCFSACFIGFLVAFLFVLFSNETVFADNTLSVSISDNYLGINVMPRSSSGDFVKSNNLNISVALSGEGGYSLSVKAGSTGTNATRLVHSTDSSKYFSSITATTTESTFSNVANTSYNNQWGYLPSKYDSANNTSFRPAPNENGDILDYTTASNASGSYTLAIGARANQSTAIGSYSNTFVIVAVANLGCNSNALTIDQALCMQDMNDDVINSMVEHQQYQLKDNRDWKTYYIAKMADGRVWMTQNLDLDLETTPNNVAVLTSENTDLNTFGSQNYTTTNGYSCSNPSTTTNCTANGERITFTPSAPTTTSASVYGSDSTSLPASFDDGSRYRYTDSNGSTTLYNTFNACKNAHNDGTCPHYHVGNYYNFTSAVALNTSSGISDSYTVMGNSICPAGWKLPNKREGTTEYPEMNFTWVAEGLVGDYVTGTSGTTFLPDGSTGYIMARIGPMHIATVGYIRGNGTRISYYNSSGGAYLWSNTVNSSSSAFLSYFSGVTAYPGSSLQRSFGLAVRCVARESSSGSTTVSFNKNANDATGSMDTQYYNANTLHALPSNGFSRSGYVFDSWNTKPDGDGRSYADEAQYYAKNGTLTTNETLYAQWAKVVTLTFNMDSNTNGVYFDGSIYTNGQTIQAIQGKSYTMVGVFRTKYGLNSWSVTSGELDTNTPTTIYTALNNATISVTSKVATVSMTSLVNPSTPVSSTCETDPLNLELVYDPRDNEAYYVARLCDGRYWMLDNLRLDLSDSTTLNGLSTANTNATAQSLSCLKTGLYNGNPCSVPYTSAAVINQTGSSTSSNNAQIRSSFKNDIIPGTHGVASNKAGVYYNYCAVSAGSYCYNYSSGVDKADTYYDLEADICPAGWHLPTINNSSTGDFPEVQRSYSSADIFKKYFSVPYAGYFGSSRYDVNQVGRYWSSTYSNSYYMMIYSIGLNSMGSTNQSRDYSLSVRCVLGGV